MSANFFPCLFLWLLFIVLFCFALRLNFTLNSELSQKSLCSTGRSLDQRAIFQSLPLHCLDGGVNTWTLLKINCLPFMCLITLLWGWVIPLLGTRKLGNKTGITVLGEQNSEWSLRWIMLLVWQFWGGSMRILPRRACHGRRPAWRESNSVCSHGSVQREKHHWCLLFLLPHGSV